MKRTIKLTEGELRKLVENALNEYGTLYTNDCGEPTSIEYPDEFSGYDEGGWSWDGDGPVPSTYKNDPNYYCDPKPIGERYWSRFPDDTDYDDDLINYKKTLINGGPVLTPQMKKDNDNYKSWGEFDRDKHRTDYRLRKYREKANDYQRWSGRFLDDENGRYANWVMSDDPRRSERGKERGQKPSYESINRRLTNSITESIIRRLRR